MPSLNFRLLVSAASALLLVTAAFLSPVAVTPAAALPGVEDCPEHVGERLIQAKQFLIGKQNILADDFEIDGRGGQERRSRRQILRRIEKLNFVCKTEKNCDTHTAVQGTIVGGNRVRMCSASLEGDSFCNMVGQVAHEFGHNAHIPRARAGRHHKRGHGDPDKVYQFGYFARELCVEEYGFGFRVGERDSAGRQVTPVRSAGLVAPKDLIVYPHKGFQGHPVHFSVIIFKGEYAIDRVATRHRRMNDLRHIGLAEGISSVKVNRGRWEVCGKKDFQGTCEVVDSTIDDLSSIGMNNKISSIRFLGD